MGRGSAERSSKPAVDYLARIRDIEPGLAAAADEIDRRRELPERIVDALIERGFFRLLLPHSLDGAELLPTHYVPIIEALAKIDASTAWCVNQNSGCSMTSAYLTPEVAREIFGGERGILAWGPGPGEARIVPGGYRVTATWAFASGSHHASWLGCHVPIIESDGRPRLNPNGTPVIRTMLFPKGATEFTDIWHTIGLRGTGSDQYSVKDLFVPEDHSVDVLSRRDMKAREEGLLYRFSSLILYAAGFAGVALGIARSTLGHFIELARDKIPRGARGTLRENNVVQSQVAQCEARLRSSRALIHETLAEMWDEAERKGEFLYDQHVRLRLCTTWAIHQARDVVATVYGAAGSTAVFNENPFERRLRDIHAGTQQGQGRPIHFETVGQVLLGLPPQGRMFR